MEDSELINTGGNDAGFQGDAGYVMQQDGLGDIMSGDEYMSGDQQQIQAMQQQLAGKQDDKDAGEVMFKPSFIEKGIYPLIRSNFNWIGV